MPASLVSTGIITSSVVHGVHYTTTAFPEDMESIVHDAASAAISAYPFKYQDWTYLAHPEKYAAHLVKTELPHKYTYRVYNPEDGFAYVATVVITAISTAPRKGQNNWAFRATLTRDPN